MSWIKVETHSFDKIEIYSIAQNLGIDPDSAFGKCCRVWAWFDANTIDGVTLSVTKALLDRQCSVTGFCDAMISSGWMHDDGEFIKLPYYDRHNSKTAKSRALGAIRQSKFKSNATGNADGNATGNDTIVTKTLPKSSHREEKIREEEIREDKPLKSKPLAPATRLPKDWEPREVDLLFAKQERPEINPRSTADQFRDYWIAKPGKDGMKADWSATWRNWVRRQNDQTARASPNYQTPNEKAKSWADRLTGKTRENERTNIIIDINTVESSFRKVD